MVVDEWNVSHFKAMGLILYWYANIFKQASSDLNIAILSGTELSGDAST